MSRRKSRRWHNGTAVPNLHRCCTRPCLCLIVCAGFARKRRGIFAEARCSKAIGVQRVTSSAAAAAAGCIQVLHGWQRTLVRIVSIEVDCHC